MYFISKICKVVSDDGQEKRLNADKSKKGLFKFRLLDDDGEIYFYGYSSSCDDNAAFEPLDEYGACYGCTEIQYKQPNGEYETL